MSLANLKANNGFNRNIVECKVNSEIEVVSIIVVLIETLWNVKEGRKADCIRDTGVLIETLWNVKTCISFICLTLFSF